MTKSHVLLILVGFIVYIIIEKNAKFLFEVCVIFFLIKFMDSLFPMEPRTRIPSFILSWLIPPYYKLSHRFLLGCVEFSALQYMWHVPVWLFSATEFLPFTLFSPFVLNTMAKGSISFKLLKFNLKVLRHLQNNSQENW